MLDVYEVHPSFGNFALRFSVMVLGARLSATLLLDHFDGGGYPPEYTHNS